MCNVYIVRPRKLIADEFSGLVSRYVQELPSPLVRRSGRGVAVVQGEDGLMPKVMDWGFPHPKYKLVNNARYESLKRGMWVEPMKSARCLVPISSFFEWQHLPGGEKLPFEFRHPEEEWLWVAGLFGGEGEHFATITTEPPTAVAAIHDRLLAIVSFSDGLAFLRGEALEFRPYQGPLSIAPCESPLKRKKSGEGGPQGSLF